MADTVKISELPVATTSAAADSIPIVQGGVTKQIHPGAGGGLAADSVPDCGIGAVGTLVTDFDTITGDGIFFRTTATPAHGPATDYFVGWQLYVSGNVGYKIQFAKRIGSSGFYWRSSAGGGGSKSRGDRKPERMLRCHLASGDG